MPLSEPESWAPIGHTAATEAAETGATNGAARAGATEPQRQIAGQIANAMPRAARRRQKSPQLMGGIEPGAHKTRLRSGGTSRVMGRRFSRSGDTNNCRKV